MKHFVPLFLLCIFLSKFSFCQQQVIRVGEQNNRLQSMLDLYENYMGPQAELYNGADYVPFLFRRDGTPFYDSDTLRMGWISYNHFLYRNIPMQYDISRDQLIILHKNGRSRFYLNNSMVDSFYFANHTFIRLDANAAKNVSTPGFYQVLVNGNVMVAALRKKSTRETIKDNQVWRIFDNADRLFLVKNGKFIEVRSSKEVLRTLGDKRNELKKLMRANKLKFGRKNFEKNLLEIVKIYDQLT